MRVYNEGDRAPDRLDSPMCPSCGRFDLFPSDDFQLGVMWQCHAHDCMELYETGELIGTIVKYHADQKRR